MRHFRNAALLFLAALRCPPPAPAETLDNGIELPRVWPPRLSALPDALPTPPYLLAPPAVLPIDLGCSVEFMFGPAEFNGSAAEEIGSAAASVDGSAGRENTDGGSGDH